MEAIDQGFYSVSLYSAAATTMPHVEVQYCSLTGAQCVRQSVRVTASKGVPLRNDPCTSRSSRANQPHTNRLTLS